MVRAGCGRHPAADLRSGAASRHARLPRHDGSSRRAAQRGRGCARGRAARINDYDGRPVRETHVSQAALQADAIEPPHEGIRQKVAHQTALRLEDLKNEFIVFRDIDTDKVTVIYKRRDNNLGLIAPEF